MNRTTVKRGIGAVILALIAAALLAFLLKDKAAQRQEVVEIALPGTDGSIQTSDQTTRLPTLTTDNSGEGNVIANAGAGNGSGNQASVNTSGDNGTIGASTTAASGSNSSDGTVVASAAAVGAAAGSAAVTAGAANNANKNIDFSVKPKASSKASSEFLDLDLVNNGDNAAASNTGASANAATATVAAATTTAQSTAPESTVNTTNNDQGVVIASTSPKTNSGGASATQPRLIGEKRSVPVKSARTAKVVTKAASNGASTKSNTNKSTSSGAKNGYAVQLLATSSSTRANNLKNVMSGEGYPTYVTQTKQNGKTLYRVRIGQYSTKSKALKAQAAMKRRYKKNTNVNRSAVVAR